MRILPKKKYRVRHEPDHWKGKSHPKYRNVTQYGVGGSHSNTARSKASVHPIGLSGRTCGRLIRNFRDREKKK